MEPLSNDPIPASIGLFAHSPTVVVGVVGECRSETVDVKYRGSVELSPFACSTVDRSSFIRRVCYDAAHSYMIVKLKETYYHYCDIDSTTVDAFKAADSIPGGFSMPRLKAISSAGPAACHRTESGETSRCRRRRKQPSRCSTPSRRAVTVFLTHTVHLLTTEWLIPALVELSVAAHEMIDEQKRRRHRVRSHILARRDHNEVSGRGLPRHRADDCRSSLWNC